MFIIYFLFSTVSFVMWLILWNFIFSLSNESAAEAILTEIRETFQKSSFQIKKPKMQVRILNGSEEGTFSWITTNYLSKRLGLVWKYFLKNFCIVAFYIYENIMKS